jgi:hypothetical protein
MEGDMERLTHQAITIQRRIGIYERERRGSAIPRKIADMPLNRVPVLRGVTSRFASTTISTNEIVETSLMFSHTYEGELFGPDAIVEILFVGRRPASLAAQSYPISQTAIDE